MREPPENHMFQSIELLLDRLIDDRIGMPKNINPPGTDRIQILLALEIFQPDALAGFDGDHRHRFAIAASGHDLSSGCKDAKAPSNRVAPSFDYS